MASLRWIKLVQSISSKVNKACKAADDRASKFLFGAWLLTLCACSSGLCWISYLLANAAVEWNAAGACSSTWKPVRCILLLPGNCLLTINPLFLAEAQRSTFIISFNFLLRGIGTRITNISGKWHPVVLHSPAASHKLFVQGLNFWALHTWLGNF